LLLAPAEHILAMSLRVACVDRFRHAKGRERHCPRPFHFARPVHRLRDAAAEAPAGQGM
jgi:hypothetical protein